MARVAGKDYFEPFTNRSSVGRNGGGDTTFAGYMAWPFVEMVSVTLHLGRICTEDLNHPPLRG